MCGLVSKCSQYKHADLPTRAEEFYHNCAEICGPGDEL